MSRWSMPAFRERAGRQPRIALLAEPSDGPARRIAAALKRLGAESVRLSLRTCGFDTRAPFGLTLPGFEGELPAAVLVRGIPAGGFEQVTLRLGVLHALREAGVMIWNDARAIEFCVDKSMTTHLIAKAGLATPATFTAQSREEALAVAERECAGGAALVVKPLFGAQGRGLHLIRSAEDLPAEAEVAGLYYLQHFVEPAGAHWQDYRLFVCGGKVIAGMMRIGASWITNVKRGGRPQPAVLTADLIEAAERASRAVGADYAGVDLIRGRDGTLFTLEVNSMPAWSGLEAANPGLVVADILVERFLAALHQRGRASRPAATGS
jgi:tetrahydromethanopterin:alpha-L-glutamate ligase